MGGWGATEEVFAAERDDMKQKPTCPHCGSDDILCDAIASWDMASQKWVLEDTYDSEYFCRACEAETKYPNWVPA